MQEATRVFTPTPGISRGVILVALFLFYCSAVRGQQITWITNLDEATRIARETGKPVLYDFTAKWCGPCKRMDRDFWPRADVAELAKQFVCVKVDYDVEKEMRAKYRVNAIPNVVFTDPWGRGLLGQLGFSVKTEGEIFEKIKLLPKDFTSVRDAGNTLETDQKDLNALHQFAAFYQEKKLYWLGSEYYGRLKYLESDPTKRESILANLAFNHLRMGEPANAIERIEELQKEYPKSQQNDLYLYGLILAHASKNNPAKANKYLTDLKANYPRSTYIGAATEATTNFGGTR
ncbi:MAG TPA: thioredoxin family protein [Pyrinomonadaceae bacterium]|nr:thioredoxin family protein [Pyrinomonadaceae bacterium]